MDELTIIKPDDWHVHLRDEAILERTVPDAARQFSRVMAMPNLTPPICNVAQAERYYQRIKKWVPKECLDFSPLIALYLTEQTTVTNIADILNSVCVHACKLYFVGATTNAGYGVKDLTTLYPVFEAMQTYDIPLLIHGETAEGYVDIFDREAYFIKHYLLNLIKQFPKLRIVLEHISTKVAVQFVQQAPKTIAATITPHHLLYNRNHLLANGIRPHYYCLPILKRKEDQHALIKAATSGNPKFFLGTDSAPHDQAKKETSCGCAGIYNMNVAIELYVTVFEQVNALDKLQGFASKFGAAFYQLPENKTKITLVKKNQQIPERLDYGKGHVVPLMAGQSLHWKIVTLET